MFCIYCNGDTAVTNSRKQKKTNSIWRRRRCLECDQMVTTVELADLSSAVLVISPAKKKPVAFSRDKLFISIYTSMKHRSSAIMDAEQIASTVIAQLRPSFSEGQVTTDKIAQATYKVLKRFDTPASTQYKAFHPECRTSR